MRLTGPPGIAKYWVADPARSPWITQLAYEVYLNEDGEPYVSSLD